MALVEITRRGGLGYVPFRTRHCQAKKGSHSMKSTVPAIPETRAEMFRAPSKWGLYGAAHLHRPGSAWVGSDDSMRLYLAAKT